MLETSTLAAAATSGCSARLYQHMLGLLLCPAKSTLSNLICARGGQHADWSADYRLYSRERVDESVLFGPIANPPISFAPIRTCRSKNFSNTICGAGASK